jgi:hypothetical protein
MEFLMLMLVKMAVNVGWNLSNRPLLQGALKIYTGSVVRVSGISDNEPPTLVLGPDKFEWSLLDQLLFPASR